MLLALKDFQDAAQTLIIKDIQVTKSYETLKFFSIIGKSSGNDAKSKLKQIEKIINKLKHEYDSIPQTRYIMSHGDFALFNILFNERGVSSINDFDNVTYFPRVHDLAEFVVSASIVHYLGPISNLRLPVFLKPNESVLSQILDFYSKFFSLSPDEIRLLSIITDIVWLEILLLAVLKDDYKINDIMGAIKALDGGVLRSKILKGLQKREKRIFLWDFHGTLETGTLFVLTEIANTLFKEYGSDKKYTSDEFAKTPSFSWITFFQTHFPDFSSQRIKTISQSAYDENRFSHLLEKHSRVRPEADKVLQFIKDAGGVNVVVSHSRQDKLAHYIKHVGLDSYVDQYYGIDDGTIMSQQDVLKRKTAKIKEILNQYPDHVSFAVGDTERDFHAARSAGIERFYWIFSLHDTAHEQDLYKNITSNKLRFITNLEEIIQDL